MRALLPVLAVLGGCASESPPERAPASTTPDPSGPSTPAPSTGSTTPGTAPTTTQPTDPTEPATDPFTPFESTVTVVVDGTVLGDGSTLWLHGPTVGYDAALTELIVSNPSSAELPLAGDPDDWLTGDERVAWHTPPPASLQAGEAVVAVLAVHPDHEGAVAAELTLPAPEPVTLLLQSEVAGPLPTVLVGRMGRTAVSFDHGVTWSDRQEIDDPYADEWRHPDTLQDITWGDGRFVAVGGGDGVERIAWSVDGLSWTDVGDPDRGPVNTVAFGRLADGTGRFVATVGNDLLWSPDGESWILESHPGWEGLSALAFGGDRWVGVGGWRGVTLDGQTWLSELDGDSLSDVVYAEGLFVAVGSGGRVAWSVDGIDWTEQILDPDTNYSRVAYGGGRFVTGGWPGGQYVSDDGMSWTHEGGNELMGPFGYTNGHFVGSTWRDRLWYSPDGVQWSMSQDNSDPEWAGFTSMATAQP